MVKVGIIGAGCMGKIHADMYARLGNIKVVAVADPRIDKAEEIAEKFHAEVYASSLEMIKNVDMNMIDICLPTPFHKEYSLIAFEKGIHVLCEKPIALNIEDATEMINASEQSGAMLMIAHCLRFSREYYFLKVLINDLRYGKLLSLNMHRNSPTPVWSEGNWLADRSKSGGVAMDLHIHDTDMALYLLGMPHAVTSYGSSINISTLYEYPGTTVFAEASWRPQNGFPYSMGYDALFEKATVVYKNSKVTICENEKAPFEMKESDWITQQGSINLTEDFYFNEINYFTSCIESGRKQVISLPEDSLNSLKIVLAEINSAIKCEKILL